MSKKKAPYWGYQKPAPEKIRIVPVEKKIEDEICEGFTQTWSETRYVIVDAETGEVYDDAQGYGYKSEQAARKAFAYKSRPKAAFAEEERVKAAVREFCSRHKDIERMLAGAVFDAMHDHEKISDKELEALIPEDVRAEMTFTVKQLRKYW